MCIHNGISLGRGRGALSNTERNCVRSTSEEELVRFGNWLHLGDDEKRGRERGAGFWGKRTSSVCDDIE